MADRGLTASGGRGGAIAIAAIAVLVLLALAGYFAGLQNVWIDESTQLSGSALPFGRMLAWLAGHPEPLGVPGDRMPPVSYAIDALCGRTLCGDVTAFRWLHLLILAAGVGALVLLAALRYGLLGAAVAAVFLVLTPQMQQTGVEIRAYPLFFAVTVLQLWLLFGLVEADRVSLRRLIVFALAGMLAIYTHFFGVVSSSALFTGLIAARARDRRTMLWIVGAWAAVLLSAIGIAPFVLGASAISNGSENAGVPGLREIVTFLLRIVGHSSMMFHPVLLILFCLGLGALLLIATLRLVRAFVAGPATVAEPALAVLVALAAGTTVTILAAFVIHGFNPLKPSYSVWLLPLIALLAAAACGDRRGWVRIAAPSAAAVMIVALLPMTAVFVAHAGWFVHGPERAIGAEIGDTPARTAIVYVDDGWAYAYFPLIYRYHGAIGQYALDAEGRLHAIAAGGDAETPVLPQAALRRYDRLLLVSIQQRSYHELRAQDEGYVDPVDSIAPRADLIGPDAGAWHSGAAVISPGIYWLRLTRLQRTDAP